MFEPNMDEYLAEEVEWAERVLEGICKQWDETRKHSHESGPTFLNSSNPDQIKRNVLAGFKDVLLLPVTIVPRTVTYGVTAIGSTAVSGLSMLNPQKWSGQPAAATVEEPIAGSGAATPDIGAIDLDAEKTDKADEVVDEKAADSANGDAVATVPKTDSAFDKLQLLVSLDTALELIHADRDSLKRTETFANYPGKYGEKVRETIEEIFILLLKAAGDRHIAPGFRM